MSPALITRRLLEEIADRDFNLIQENGRFLASARGQNFDCEFGRDSAWESIFAVQAYKYNPDSALIAPIPKTLLNLYRLQGQRVNPNREETPWKIPHEYRYGTKQQKKLKTFAKAGWPVENYRGQKKLLYYGSVDATILWSIACMEYFKATKDIKFFTQVEDGLRKALLWPEVYGDIDIDGFVEFKAKNRKALVNQGWQDSFNSILMENGKRPSDPIALAEVQAYTYGAWVLASKVFKDEDLAFANNLAKKASILKEKFNQDFWLDDKKYFAQALYGKSKKQLSAISSNIGHCLYFKIIDEKKAPCVAKRLMQKDMFTPWGIRTLSSKSPNFSLQPQIGYHLGTVWPFDNAVCADGLRKYGFKKEAELIDMAVLKTFKAVGSQELITVDKAKNLILYPSSCNPQGWTVCAVKKILAQYPLSLFDKIVKES